MLRKLTPEGCLEFFLINMTCIHVCTCVCVFKVTIKMKGFHTDFCIELN